MIFPWWSYRWPSLKCELEIVYAAKTGHEAGPFQHELERQVPKAVPAEPREPTAADLSRMESALERMEK